MCFLKDKLHTYLHNLSLQSFCNVSYAVCVLISCISDMIYILKQTPKKDRLLKIIFMGILFNLRVFSTNLLRKMYSYSVLLEIFNLGFETWAHVLANTQLSHCQFNVKWPANIIKIYFWPSQIVCFVYFFFSFLGEYGQELIKKCNFCGKLLINTRFALKSPRTIFASWAEHLS